MLQTKEEIKEWLNTYGVRSYIVNDDLTVVVYGSVDLIDKGLESIDVQFGIIRGDFYCSENELTSLFGSPKEVSGNFSCGYNKLMSLEGCPAKVDSFFNCKNNKLIDLKHSPQKIGGGFNCSFNKLISLEYCPKEINGNFYCNNNKLKNLDFMPKKVKDRFYCNNNTKLGDLQFGTTLEAIKTIFLKNDLTKDLKDINLGIENKIKI